MNRLTAFFAKNKVIPYASGFAIAMSFSEAVNSLAKDVIIPGLVSSQKANIWEFYVNLLSLFLVVTVVYLIAGEFISKLLGMDKVMERTELRSTIKEKVVEQKVKEHPVVAEEIAKKID